MKTRTRHMSLDSKSSLPGIFSMYTEKGFWRIIRIWNMALNSKTAPGNCHQSRHSGCSCAAFDGAIPRMRCKSLHLPAFEIWSQHSPGSEIWHSCPVWTSALLSWQSAQVHLHFSLFLYRSTRSSAVFSKTVTILACDFVFKKKIDTTHWIHLL